MMSANPPIPSIAILIPCYQEEQTIGKVIADFQRALPHAQVYVYDNNCTDRTAEIARQAGAVVRREKRQGKGFVVASMFEQVDADILVMVDGDDTYEAEAVGALLAPILKGDADMTVAVRQHAYAEKSFRPFHLLGNRLICGIINRAFGSKISDIFSGYRAFTREAAAQIPITAAGFDVETELTLQALYRGLVITEIVAPYRARPEGSFSKLRTVSDGLLVLLKLFRSGDGAYAAGALPRAGDHGDRCALPGAAGRQFLQVAHRFRWAAGALEALQIWRRSLRCRRFTAGW